MNLEFYLDNAATTTLLPEALEAALPYLTENFGNPSSLHSLGMEARRAVQRSREGLALELGLPPKAVIFTSGGTESSNLALRGVFASERFQGGRLLISALEHPSVREAAAGLAAEGVTVKIIPVTGEGVVDLSSLESMLDQDVRMVSCMAVNNELGTAQPIGEIGELMKKKVPKAVFHVDAVQVFTKMTIPWKESGIDLISLSGHKIHGPKGVGALVRCRPLTLEPWLRGGGQEEGLRSGTENPFAIVAFAVAAQKVSVLQKEQRETRGEYHRRWLDFLGEFPRLKVFRSVHEVPFIINFHISPIPGEVTLHHLEEEGLLVSTGAACSTRKTEPSPALLAAGLNEQEALSSVRLSFSIHNTLQGLEDVFPAFRKAITKLERL